MGNTFAFSCKAKVCPGPEELAFGQIADNDNHYDHDYDYMIAKDESRCVLIFSLLMTKTSPPRREEQPAIHLRPTRDNEVVLVDRGLAFFRPLSDVHGA